MPIPSQVPVRYPNGVSTDPPYGPLANYGLPNPFFYHFFEDDFDSLVSNYYTQTKTGNGTIAHAAGDGGTILFTTNSSTPAATDVCSIQLPAASFSVTLGKKMFGLARFQTNDATNPEITFGLIQTTATPFTVVDGIYINKPAGAANTLALKHAKASTITTSAFPTSAYSLAANTNIDVGFYLDRNGILYGFVGSQLVGWLPQSERPAGQVAGPAVAMTTLNAGNITTANLNLTLAIRSGTTASKTMTADFMMVAKER